MKTHEYLVPESRSFAADGMGPFIAVGALRQITRILTLAVNYIVEKESLSHNHTDKRFAN